MKPHTGNNFSPSTEFENMQTLTRSKEAALPSVLFPLPVQRPEARPAIHNRIVIAEDDALVRVSLAVVLECEGFVVDEAENGAEAVSLALHNSPDHILLD